MKKWLKRLLRNADQSRRARGGDARLADRTGSAKRRSAAAQATARQKRRAPSQRPARTRFKDQKLALEQLEERTLMAFVVGPNIDINNQPLHDAEMTIAINPANPINLIAATNSVSDLINGNDRVWFSFDAGTTWNSSVI